MSTTLADQILSTEFFEGLSPEHAARLAEVAEPVAFPAGAIIFRESDPADACFLLLEGDVALELMLPGRGRHVIETLHAGEVLGLSWLFTPFRWSFDAEALTTVRAIRFEGAGLREAKAEDPALGYELLQRFAEVLVQRMQSTRLQLLDVYGTPR